MENLTTVAVAFVGGMLFYGMWNYLFHLGSSVLMMKSVVKDCVLVLAKNIQTTYELNYIKQEIWKISGRDDKYIEFQKKIDERELTSMKNTAIRNFINSIPPRYNNIVEFHDWDSAMQYIDKVIKEGK